MKPILTFWITLLPILVSAQSLPDWLYGEWDGMGVQSNTQTEWLTWMSFFPDDEGPQIEYPSLECSGHWKPIGIEGHTLVFTEEITQNKGLCSQHDRVRVRFVREGVLEVTYAHHWAPDHIIARLTLKRRVLP